MADVEPLREVLLCHGVNQGFQVWARVHGSEELHPEVEGVEQLTVCLKLVQANNYFTTDNQLLSILGDESLLCPTIMLLRRPRPALERNGASLGNLRMTASLSSYIIFKFPSPRWRGKGCQILSDGCQMVIVRFLDHHMCLVL